jgi:myosin heavy subunit
MRALIAILLLMTVGLGAGLFYRHTKAKKQTVEDTQTITQLSTKVQESEKKLAEQTAVNAVLDRDLAARTQQLQETSNTLVTVSTTLAKVREEAQIAATNAAADIAKRDARINELETQRDDLTKRMTDLNGQISGYESQIAEIQNKLTTSEGDREYLLAEMKRLQREKNDLERQFNDIAMLREQVRKMRDELSISRRLDWIRRGLYGSLKGAERLQKGPGSPSTNNYDLNVELKESGAVNVTPLPNPPAPATNAPAPQ